MRKENEKAEILKWLLGRIYRARQKKKRLDERLAKIRAERNAPLGGVRYKPLPRSSGEDEGAAGIVLKMSEIEEKIYKQQEEIEQAIVCVMDILDELPWDSLEREICEMRHIDTKPWKEIEDSIPMSYSQCNRRYNRALEMLMSKERIEQMIEENKEEYTKWKADRGMLWQQEKRRRRASESKDGRQCEV